MESSGTYFSTIFASAAGEGDGLKPNMIGCEQKGRACRKKCKNKHLNEYEVWTIGKRRSPGYHIKLQSYIQLKALAIRPSSDMNLEKTLYSLIYSVKNSASLCAPMSLSVHW